MTEIHRIVPTESSHHESKLLYRNYDLIMILITPDLGADQIENFLISRTIKISTIIVITRLV